MNKVLIIVLASVALAACRQEAESPPATEAKAVAAKPVQVSGKEAYEQVCAHCHDGGLDGAPRTDHPEDWAGRSRLWQAVLYEHANKGYMEMPAKGGDQRLSEEVVAAAAEYMLERTYPDLPVD